MVNNFNHQLEELPEKLPLEQLLEETQQALMRSQVRLHQLQESVVAESALVQLRGQYLQSQYEQWIIKACMAWIKGDLLKLTQCLEASLECTSLKAQAVTADWLRHLDQFSKDMKNHPVLSDHLALNLESLLNTSNWQTLMTQVTVSH